MSDRLDVLVAMSDEDRRKAITALTQDERWILDKQIDYRFAHPLNRNPGEAPDE